MKISLSDVVRCFFKTALGILLGVAALTFGAQPLCANPEVFMVSYVVSYNQSGASSVSLASNTPYLFMAGVQEDSATSVFSSGTLTIPSGYEGAMDHDSSSMMWLAADAEASFSTLTSYFPTGTYTMKMTKKTGGTVSTSFNLTSSTLPPAPVISNYSALQSIDPSQDLVLSWGSWSGGTSSDHILVEIDSDSGTTCFNNDDSGNNALSGTATSVTIPAGTLAINQSYRLVVTFVKCLYVSESGSVSAYPSAGKLTSCIAINYMTIATSRVTDIFAALDHEYGWVEPDNNSVVNSMGWFYDGHYPWIYSASADILANGSYNGDGKGWLYVYQNNASLDDGFYFYRYATHTWGWTNYSWGGWFYDYGTSTWVDLTPAK